MLKKYFLVLICFILCESFLLAINNSAITWNVPSGRTGDQLLSYCFAKWVSYYFNIPLLIKPFLYSDQFIFSEVEQKFSDMRVKNLHKKKISFKYGNYKERHAAIDSDFNEKNTLFLIDLYFSYIGWDNFDPLLKENIIFPYCIQYTSSFCHKGDTSQRVRFNYLNYTVKKDVKFRLLLKSLLQTKEKLEVIAVPNDVISVAVHVRKGGGYDQPYKSDQIYDTRLNFTNYGNYFANINNDTMFVYSRMLRDNIITKVKVSENPNKIGYIDIVRPLKHPPDQYYIDQIKAIYEIFNLPLFIYIFTDDQYPEKIVNVYKKALNNKGIIFACRHEKNNYYSNILTDLFAMSKFDCLIRAYSSLSQVAQLIGNYKLVISPFHALWKGNELIIDEILIDKSEDFEEFIKSIEKKSGKLR